MISPEAISPGGIISRIIERLVTDFPLPDSPTSARVLPRSMTKLTSSTALTVPARV
jgi:hypothetical protein